MTMRLQKMLTKEIFAVTAKIQNEYPELYQHLSETPLFSPQTNKAISVDNYQEYLESIQMQFNVFKELKPNH